MRRADLQNWYLEGLLDRTKVLRLLVSILGCRSEQGLVRGTLTSFSLLDAGQRLFTETTIEWRPATFAVVSAALGLDTGSSCQPK